MSLEGWEETARAREDAEIAFYDTLLEDGEVDEVTRAVVEAIRESEHQHRRHLGGKWMSA